MADLTNRVRQLKQQLRMATLNAQQADPGDQGLHVQCQQTIAALTNQVADLTNGARQLEQQLRMAMADLTNRQLRMTLVDLTNRVRRLEEKEEEEELASHMKNLNLK
ncbi:unnamed protein product [Porites lobata]|uniref:Uncharacterized protein n=1 Tax=Porites lobata TaxID=104759 RepID=A0ABN8P7V3_9CNID|nr:unnamed protein product [Porites lobata]